MVMLASGTWCVELSATRNKVPHYRHGGGHLLNLWGPPLESSLRLVLGDEDVSGVLVIDMVTDQTQYSCYTWYSRYMHGHAGVRHMVCGTKCHMEQSATPQTWWGHLLNPWGPPLESHIAACRHDGGILSALTIQTQYMIHLITQQQ